MNNIEYKAKIEDMHQRLDVLYANEPKKEIRAVRYLVYLMDACK